MAAAALAETEVATAVVDAAAAAAVDVTAAAARCGGCAAVAADDVAAVTTALLLLVLADRVRAGVARYFRARKALAVSVQSGSSGSVVCHR